MRWGRLGGIALRFGLMAAWTGIFLSRAAAQPTTQRPASIVIFPKVIADGSRDTVIQLTNTSNNVRSALCLYLDGSLSNPSLPQSPSNAPLCAQTNFDLTLAAQQPTYWVASKGRAVDPAAPAGIAPGLIPPVGGNFVGALFCLEVDPSGAPISGNSLIGAAALQDVASGDVAQYSAIGLRGFGTNDGDGILCLGGSVTATCPMGAEYDACPAAWSLDHLADGAQDSIVGTGSTVRTELTVVPCAQDFYLASPTSVTVAMQTRNEFEVRSSGAFTFDCWTNRSATPAVGVLGTTYALTSLSSPSGVAMVAQEFHVDNVNALSTSVATNLHVGSAPPGPLGSDQITLPPGFGSPAP